MFQHVYKTSKHSINSIHLVNTMFIKEDSFIIFFKSILGLGVEAIFLKDSTV